MAVLVTLVIFLLVAEFGAIKGLKCHEGFNISFNDIPLNFWKQKECVGNSECIGQEVNVDLIMQGMVFKSAMRYGACMSKAYADYMSCENLFTEKSTIPISDLLNVIPGAANSINDTIYAFARNTVTSLKQFLSNGKGGMKSFVDGIFKFFTNFGFNFDKAVPLKPSIANMLTKSIEAQDIHRMPTNLQYDATAHVSDSVATFFNDFARLDTKNSDFENAIRSILANFGVDTSRQVDGNSMVKTLIERCPGLMRSILPPEWKADLWYDVAFKLVGKVDPKNWTKSTEDMVAVIRTSYKIPEEIKDYVQPILDSLPDLARGSQINETYVGRWSLELLKKYSVQDDATKALSSSVINFARRFSGEPLQLEYYLTIEWLPGLFYKTFPGDVKIIQEVYKKMADGIKSFNLSNLESTAPETALSRMIMNLIEDFRGHHAFHSQTLIKAFVVNFSNMFYELMKVGSEDYTKYINDFAKVIDDEFKSWPNINVGNMISKLITAMGGKVPPELNPMLQSFQPIISAAIKEPFDSKGLIAALRGVTSSYKTAFPESAFPELVERLVNIIHQSVISAIEDTPVYMLLKAYKLGTDLAFWIIDFTFALVKAYDYSSTEVYQLAVKAWPDFGLYMRILGTMDSEDVKQTIKAVIKYMNETRWENRNTKGAIDAVKPSIKKIAKSLTKLVGEMRQTFSPSACRFGTCSDDLCNNQQFISSKEQLKRAKGPIVWTISTTTSAADRISYYVRWQLVAMLGAIYVVAN